MRIPSDLRVEMRVNVDEAGRDRMSCRVDFLATLGIYLPNARDRVSVDRDIRRETRSTAPIDNASISNHEIM